MAAHGVGARNRERVEAIAAPLGRNLGRKLKLVSDERTWNGTCPSHTCLNVCSGMSAPDHARPFLVRMETMLSVGREPLSQ